MIAGPDGSAYVTQFGREMWDTDTAFEPTVMIRVAPDGAVEVGADDLMVPNGVAVADDGKSLVVAESAAARLSRYSVRDGLLSDRVNVPLTPAADMPFVAPDGICLDAEGGIWAADPLARRVVHLSDDTIDQEIPLEDFSAGLRPRRRGSPHAVRLHQQGVVEARPAADPHRVGCQRPGGRPGTRPP